MGLFSRLGVRAKLLLSFLTVAVILSGVAAYELVQLGKINANIGFMYDNQLLPLSALGKSSETKTRVGRAAAEALLRTDADSKNRALAAIEELKKDFEKFYNGIVVPQATTVEEKAMADKISSLFPICAGAATEAVTLSLKGESENAIAALERMRNVANELDSIFEAEVELNERFAAEGMQASNEAYQSTFWLVACMLFVGISAALLISWMISKWFTAALAKIAEVAKAMSERNFDVHIADMGEDDVGKVIKALRLAVNSIKSALKEVRDVAGTVSLAASQLSASSRDIATGAQSQASSLEETASSLEEITSTVKQNADNAQQARQLANGSRDIAERGGSVVNEAVEAMDQINQSSSRIADIITTIDEIAFQTNLLALNAAVEAARAGEQGRGFAVVAAEVRNLAQRSAGSAKEIKRLIQDSVSKVANGTELVNKSGKTLGEIVSSVKRVTDIVTEIAAASQEQLTGIEQVNKAVSQMDRVTQANANQTEEVSETAASLLSHAKQLSELVKMFKLDAQNEVYSAPVLSSSAHATAANATLKHSKSARHDERTTDKPEAGESFGEREFIGAPIVMNSSSSTQIGVMEF